jgi:hypothetical protein
MLEKKEEMVLNKLDNNSSLVLNAANKLCDDLIEEELMAAEDHKEPPTKPSKPIWVHKKRV